MNDQLLMVNWLFHSQQEQFGGAGGWGVDGGAGGGGGDMGNKACGRSIIHGSTGACSEQ